MNRARNHRNAPPKAQGFPSLGARAMCAFILCITAAASAQTLDDRLDEEAYLRGLVELRLSDVLDQYAKSHPSNDPFRAARFEVAAQRIALTDPNATIDQRMASLDRLGTIRAQLVADHPDDARAPVLLADQAADAFFDLLPTDAAGFAAILGRPSPQQLAIAKRAAREMLSQSQQAEQRIDQALRALESRPGFATDFALQDQRRRLAEEQRDRRIPFLQGIAALLQAELNTTNQDERTRLYNQAVARLTPLVSSSSPTPLTGAALIQARLYLALAQSRAGNFNAADALFDGIIRDPASAQLPRDLFAARIGKVINLNGRSGDAQNRAAALDALKTLEQAYLDPSPANAFHRLAIADVRFDLLSQTTPAVAFTAYIDLLNADLGVDPAAVRAAVFQRLVLASKNASGGGGSNVTVDSLPPIVVIAHADQLARQNTPQSLSSAASMLRQVLNRQDLAATEHALALFALGRTLLAGGLELDAARAFIDLAGRFPTDPQAGRAIDLGVALAAQQFQQHPSDAAAQQVMEQGLAVALDKFSTLATIDQWRMLAARFELDRHRFDQADAALAAINKDSALWLSAQTLTAIVARERAANAEDRQRPQLLLESALGTIDAAAAQIDAALAKSASPKLQEDRALLRIAKAQTLLELERPSQALAELADLENHPGGGATAAVIAETLRVRIACHQALGHPEEAVVVVEQYLQAAPDQAVAAVLPLLASLEREVQNLIDDNREDDAKSLAQRTLEPIAMMLQQRLDSGEFASPETSQTSAGVGQRLAEAYRLSGRCAEALTWYERLLVTHPDAQPLLLGRAECLFALGSEERLAQAMNIYKRIAASGPSAGADYWLSQLRMLQILDVTGRNTQQIVPRIDRLRQADADLGGERFRRGFDTLRSKYAQ